SLNTLTPLNFVAGDPARAYFLKHRYPFTEAAASVVVDRTLHSISTLAIILIGTAAAFVELKFLPKNIKYGLPIVLAIAVVFVGFIFIHQRKGLFTFLAGITKRLRIKKTFSTSTLEKFEEVDGHIQDFYEKNKRGFWAALLSHLFGRALGIFEIFIVGHAVSDAFGLKTALLLCAAAPVINFMFTFIPGSLGIMESAYSGILYFLHFSPSIGLTIQIIRRVRAGLWTILGFILLGTHGRKKLLQAAESKEV
ncbi:MAG: flippase-like domain-containing protein, partial [Deltaproteobacteria bacterium]|nr:flippase-like domain-containing protein [Deltaproteobacteria bacterium]